MRTSCIRHPENDYYLKFYEWQLELCEGDTCQAALLSYFEHWHNVRLSMLAQEGHQREMAALHGDNPGPDMKLWQWHTMEEIERALLGIAKEDTIRKAIRCMEEKGWIKTGHNPHARYRFDRTKFYLFCPQEVQKAIDELIESGYQSRKASQTRTAVHTRKNGHDAGKIGDQSGNSGEQYHSSTPSSTSSPTGEKDPEDIFFSLDPEDEEDPPTPPVVDHETDVVDHDAPASDPQDAQTAQTPQEVAPEPDDEVISERQVRCQHGDVKRFDDGVCYCRGCWALVPAAGEGVER